MSEALDIGGFGAVMARDGGYRVLTVGAASGIGKVAALRLAELGAHVICADRNSAGVDSVALEIAAAGGKAETLAFDVADPEFLDGGLGDDRMTGGAGADTYQIGRGEGYDTIVNAHTDALADILQFGADIDESQLWFKRNGNDLEVSVIGTTDGAMISGWYSSVQNQVAAIKDASGHTLAAANVEALVAAMSAFGAPPIGQLTLNSSVQQQLQPVLAASWS